MARRGNGEGSITRKDGLYMARYTVDKATGMERKTLYAPRPARKPQISSQRSWQTYRRGSPPTPAL